ncbi:protein cornichon homolog 4-like [Rutidosis leptorrhynchoides]|uniref:protein cornichon homolog 4-like n=1 Tax=Rutidosis leptorrhynchoides TaxID=125765 RepID=UPI003A9A38A0
MGLLGWLLTFIILICLLGIVAYQLVCLADLESDYLNPYDSALKINMVVLPEIVIGGVLCVVYFLTGHWFLCLLSLPYVYFNVTLYLERTHLVDVTEIYNQLPKEKKTRAIKMGYLVVLLVISLFWLLWTTGDDDEGLSSKVRHSSWRSYLSFNNFVNRDSWHPYNFFLWQRAESSEDDAIDRSFQKLNSLSLFNSWYGS